MKQFELTLKGKIFQLIQKYDGIIQTTEIIDSFPDYASWEILELLDELKHEGLIE